jgi:hypothetical protein
MEVAMSPDDPIYDPVRQIAQATEAINRTLQSLDQNLAHLAINTQDTRALCSASLRVTRALGWGVLVMGCALLLILVVLVVHIL